MYIILVWLIMAITLASGIGYSLITMTKSSYNNLIVQKNQIRMEYIVETIDSMIKISNNKKLIPLSSIVSTGSYDARINFIESFQNTSWGSPIVYCPVSPNDVKNKNSEIINNLKDSTESYDIETETIGGIVYVSAGAPGSDALKEKLRKSNIIGIIISPAPNTDLIPKCSDIRLSEDESTYLVDNGIVNVVYNNKDNSDGKNFLLSSTGESIAGYDSSIIIEKTLSDIADYISTYSIKDATIYIPSETQNITVNDLENLADVSFGRTFKFIGNGKSSSILNVSDNSSNEYSINFSGNMLFKNITLFGLYSDIGLAVLPSGNIAIDGSNINFLRTLGGDAFIHNGSLIEPKFGSTSTILPIKVNSGRLTIDNAFATTINAPNAPIGIIVSGGDLSVMSSVSMNLGGDTAFKAENGGRILPVDSNLTASVNGTSKVLNSKIAFGSIGDSEQISVSSKGVNNIIQQSAVISCSDGSNTCSATCPENTTILNGECSSSNNAPLSGFYSNDDRTIWTCRWDLTTVTPTAPKARVNCQNTE